MRFRCRCRTTTHQNEACSHHPVETNPSVNPATPTSQMPGLRKRRWRRGIKTSARMSDVNVRGDGKAGSASTSVFSCDRATTQSPQCKDCPYTYTCPIKTTSMGSTANFGEGKGINHHLGTSSSSKSEEMIGGKWGSSSSGKEAHGGELGRENGKSKSKDEFGQGEVGEEQAFQCGECERMTKSGSSLYSMEHVAQHCTSESCWLVAHGIVYDATPFLYSHPAGTKSILRRGGKDATRDLDFHSAAARKLWAKFRIGTIRGACPNPMQQCVIS